MLTKVCIALVCAGFMLAPVPAAQAQQTEQSASRSAPGVVVPARSWDVSAQINGKIHSLLFHEGQVVTKGDLLVTFEDGIKRLKVALVRSHLNLADANLRQKQEDLSRKEELRKREAVAVAALHDAQYAAEQARLSVDTARLELELAEAELSGYKIRAPADGLISAPGMRSKANYSINESPPIATIVQLDPIHVRAQLSLERVLGRLKQGNYTAEDLKTLRVTLELPDGTGFSQTGKVKSIGFGLDPETGEGSILFEFPNPKGILRPGMQVVVVSAVD